VVSRAQRGTLAELVRRLVQSMTGVDEAAQSRGYYILIAETHV
jgi:hypothetical protein